MEPRYTQDTLRNGFQPYYSYEAQVSLGIMHSDSPYRDTTPQYHYYDCNCVECYKNHYPCDNVADCDYCTAVQSLMYDYVEHITGKQVKAEYGHIIDYVTFIELGDVELDPRDLLWQECEQCHTLVSTYTYNRFDGYCSQQCVEDSKVFYCRTCGKEEVAWPSDRCSYCVVYCSGDDGNCECEVEEEGDICEHCYYRDDCDYKAGDIVDVTDYPGLMNCWIDTKGHVRYVKYCNHDYTAERMGYSGTSGAEKDGNIHFSEYWDSHDRWRFIPERPTKAQLDTMIALCLANKHNLKMPDILVKHMEEQSNKSAVTYVGNLTTRAYYSLPIATRRALHQGD